MLVRVVLVDVNKKMIDAWQSVFEENPEVEIVHGSMLEQPVSAWVSPTNSKGSMDGGLDAVIKKHLGSKIEAKLQKEIQLRYGGSLPNARFACAYILKMRPHSASKTWKRLPTTSCAGAMRFWNTTTGRSIFHWASASMQFCGHASDRLRLRYLRARGNYRGAPARRGGRVRRTRSLRPRGSLRNRKRAV